MRNDTMSAQPGTLLATLRIKDAKELFAVVEKNRAHLRRWLPWVDEATGPSVIAEFIRKCRAGEEAGRRVERGIRHKGKLVGVVGLVDIDRVNCTAEIGYWLDEAHQGRGIMMKSVKRLMHYGITLYGINRFEIRCAVNNYRSAAVAERLGFTYEAVLRQALRGPEVFEDAAVYSLLASDYARQLVASF